MIRTPFLAKLLLTIFVASVPSKSFSYDLKHGFTGADAAAFQIFSDSFRAYYLPTHRNIEAGDHFQTPMFDKNPGSEVCFGKKAQDWSEQRSKKLENYHRAEFSISGLFFGLISAGADIEYLSGPIYDLPHIQTQYIKDSNIRAYDKVACPWLEPLFSKRQDDGEHVLIYEVIFARGWIKDKSSLRIEGNLDTSELKEVAQELEAAGVLGKFAKFARKYVANSEIKGSFYEETGEDVVEFPSTRAVAFVPYSINKSTMEEYLQVYLYKTEELEALKRACKTPDQARSYLSVRPQLIMDSGTRSPLLKDEGDHVLFDSGNPFHTAAQKIDTMVITANFMANQK